MGVGRGTDKEILNRTSVLLYWARFYSKGQTCYSESMFWPFMLDTEKAEYTVGDVLRKFGGAYRKKYRPSEGQLRVLRRLEICRTATLGGYVESCEACGVLVFHYESCRDRHCPSCGKFKKAQWVNEQQVYLLPIPYFHVIFTTDHAINGLASQNRREIYDLLFKAVSKSLKWASKKYFGGELGFTLVLHSWGQTMNEHIHIHCIVTGGALRFDQKEWVTSGKKFLFPIVELSVKFRDIFCKGLRKLYRQGRLELAGNLAELDVEALVKEMMSKKWEVFAKGFESAEKVLEYLSRYVHQVAIANYRIVNIAKGKVTFIYNDNKDGGKKKEMVLDGVEFIRRFVWHILPKGFHRIRRYGLHHPSLRKSKLERARELLGLEREAPQIASLNFSEWLEAIKGKEGINRCPRCGEEGTMSRRAEFNRVGFMQILFFVLVGIPLMGRVSGVWEYGRDHA